MPLLSLSED